MEEKNNSKKGLIIALIVVIILLLAACGYLVYDKFLSNSNNNTNQKLDKVHSVNLDKNDEKISQTFSKMIADLSKEDIITGKIPMDMFFRDLSVESKGYWFTNYYQNNVYKLHNNFNLNVDGPYIVKSDGLEKCLDEEKCMNDFYLNKYQIVYTSSEDNVKNAYFDLFGADTIYEKITFETTPGVVWNYCSEYNSYCHYGTLEGGDAYSGIYRAYFSRAKNVIDSDKDIVEVYIKYFKVDEDKLIDKNNNIIVNEIDSNNITLDFLKSYESKFNEYKFIFTKDSKGNYGFTKVEKVK